MTKFIAGFLAAVILIASLVGVYVVFGRNEIITQKTVRTSFFGKGIKKQYVTIKNLDNEIIKEYEIITKEEL